MGKTYKALKEHYDYGTIVGGAMANVFNKLAENENDGKKFRDIEDIINSVWALIPTSLKRNEYKERKNYYWRVWENIEDKYGGGNTINEKVENIKKRVLAKIQVLSDLFFHQNVWIRTQIIDIFNEEDFEIIEDEEENKDENES